MKQFTRTLLASSFLAISLFAADNSVIATVNGKNLTKEDMQSAMNAMGGANFDKLPAEEKKKAVNQLVDKILITEQAKKDGLEGSKEFKENLEKVKEELLFDSWMKKEYNGINISDNDAKNYYDTNKNQFIQPPQLKARHILVKTEAEAKALITQLSGVAKDKQENKFMDLAKQHTQDPSGKQSGGDLGWFSKDRMVKEFGDAASGMKKGEVSKTPVKTQFGYHIIYLNDKKDSKPLSFEEVKEKLKQNLKMDKLKDKISNKAKELRGKAKVDIKL